MKDIYIYDGQLSEALLNRIVYFYSSRRNRAYVGLCRIRRIRIKLKVLTVLAEAVKYSYFKSSSFS